MENLPLLSLLIFIPVVGAVLIWLFTSNNEQGANNAKNAGLFVSIVVFLLSLSLLCQFDSSYIGYQFVERYGWFDDDLAISYYLGIDGISLFFVVLTAFLLPLCLLCGWGSIKKRQREYVISFLLLESLVIGVFCALDLLLFYLFFEAVLIPMYLIIGIWGGDNRIYASFKFFLYTLAGSVFLLAALIYYYIKFGTLAIPELATLGSSVDIDTQKLLWIAMFASFAVKVPMWPFHTWLPDAHVQAPTAGSVILAGILLKMGGYGFLRLSLPLTPEASVHFADLVLILSIIALIATSLIALVQKDMKKLIAYSSVAHMAYVTVGIFSFNQQGLEGAMVQMISHGLVSGALFIVVGMLYDRLHTKEIAAYGGVASKMPALAFFFMFFTMASVGLPGTSGFVGELLVLVGAFKYSTIVGTFMAFGMILGATYALWLYRKVMFGPVLQQSVTKMEDLSIRERILFIPLVGLVLLFGIYPESLLHFMRASINNLLVNF